MWREAIEQLAVDIHPDYEITFNFGYSVKPLDGNRQIKHFLNRLQSEAYGSRWSKRCGDDRISGIGVWERVGKHENTHNHMGAAIPPAVAPVLDLQGEALWREISPRGQLHATRVRYRRKVAHYNTKTIFRADDQDRVFIYTPNR